MGKDFVKDKIEKLQELGDKIDKSIEDFEGCWL